MMLENSLFKLPLDWDSVDVIENVVTKQKIVGGIWF